MINLTMLNLAAIAALWRAAAAAPSCAARNAIFWDCVNALQAQGFTGDARRILERVAPWAR